jgi:phage tail-like protein
MPGTTRNDPYLNFNFRVEIEGEEIARFSEVDLPEGRIETIAYRAGGDSGPARQLPGRVEYGRVVLRHGFAGDPRLFQWWRAVAEGNSDRRNVAIILLDERGLEKVRWAVYEAWPAKWVGPSFRALGNDVAIETIELAHEGIEQIV